MRVFNKSASHLKRAWDYEIDASGLCCPMPILKAKKKLATMNSGEVLKLRTTDGNAPFDFKLFADQTGNRLLSVDSLSKEEFLIFLQRR